MGRRRNKRQRGTRRCRELLTDDYADRHLVRSSWFPDVTWVGSRFAARSKAGESNELAEGSMSMIQSDEKSHDVLQSELNEIKSQLMSTAKACADAINQCEGSVTETTTPEFEFRQARSICNPYESLGNQYQKKTRKRKSSPYQDNTSRGGGLSQFVNRSAIKLANIDSLSESLTSWPHETDTNFVFVDLCGAPGGFSEYILYRRSSEFSSNPCYGFGMSLLGRNSDGVGVKWAVDHLSRYHRNSNEESVSRGSFYHVCYGADGTGSIYNWDNVCKLQHDMTMIAGKNLAELVVADGGFDAQRDNSNQELIAFNLVVSQTAAALTLLREGGNFVLKMFGFRESGTRRMLTYLYSCFDMITFMKPISSRPASAERYLVCGGYAGAKHGWDGLRWRDQLIHSQKWTHVSHNVIDTLPIDALMESFDRKMLQLNIDTCRSIVNYLNEKKDHAELGDNSNTCETQRDYIDIKSYEEAWDLR